MNLVSRLLLLLLLPAVGVAQGPAVSASPVAWPELPRSSDPQLQQGLEATLDKLGLREAVSRHELAIALVDISDPANPRIAAVNGDQAMYAASLPKIAILLGAFHKANAGLMDLDAETTDDLTRMIRFSSNSAATEVLDEVGFDYLAELLQSDAYKLYDREQNGGLWVGKPYAKAGAWKRDPLHNLSHAATPIGVARFYYMLAAGRLVSPEASASMKQILAESDINHKFVRGLERHEPDSQVYRKSGTWRTYHSDSALVERDGRRYIAVALANNPSGGAWLEQLIVGLDELIHGSGNDDGS